MKWKKVIQQQDIYQIVKKKIEKKKNKTKKVILSKIQLDNTYILIGKNNIQNEYLIHKVARKNDLWFHVKDAPGAHVVLFVPDNDEDYTPTEAEIRLASNVAAYFSKYSKSSSVPVNYTKIKNLKKIPQHQGYNVIYTNNKTIINDSRYTHPPVIGHIKLFMKDIIY